MPRTEPRKKIQPHSFRSRLCCEPLSARKVAEHRPSGHLETRQGMEPISSLSNTLIIGQDDFTGLSTAYFSFCFWPDEMKKKYLYPKRFCGSRVWRSDYVWILVRWILRTDCNVDPRLKKKEKKERNDRFPSLRMWLKKDVWLKSFCEVFNSWMPRLRRQTPGLIRSDARKLLGVFSKKKKKADGGGWWGG